MEEKYIAAVDLGSANMTLAVAKVSGDDIQIVYYKSIPSDGIRNSAVFNPAKALTPLKALIDEAENELSIKILQVVAGLPRCDIRQATATSSVTRTNADESITSDEVEGIKESAQGNYPLTDAHDEIYGTIAQSFSTDEEFQVTEDDVVGMVSSQLAGNFKIFIGKKSSVKNIDKVFNNIGIAIARKYFTPATIAKAVLTSDEMNGGVALVDLGAGATSVSIFKDGVLRNYDSIPFGGRTVTMDIVSECSISERLAENLKMAYGACLPDRIQTLKEKVLNIESDDSLESKQIAVKYLSEIITAREEEIIEAILWFIQQSGMAEDLRNGIVITGGGANMCNIGVMIQEMSGYTVRVGKPRRLFSFSGIDEANYPEATNVLGMILTANGDNTPSCIDGETDDEDESPFSFESQTAPGFEPWGNEAPSEEKPQEENSEETEEEPNEIPEDAKEGDSVPLINIPGESSEEREKREKEKLKAEKRQKKEEKKNRKKMSKMQRWLDGAGNTISSIFDKAYEAGTGDNENTEEYGR